MLSTKATNFYKMKNTKIFQQSVYILEENIIHIVSLSSLYKETANTKWGYRFLEIGSS